MQFSGLQKITSFFLIFFLLFSITIRAPFLSFFSSQTYASAEPHYNLVSIIVDEGVYSKIKSKLIRYSQDVQGALENTRVVILPTPESATAFDIASLNEKLYYEGYKGVKDVDFESKLIGTLLVGDVPVPIVFDGNTSSRTIVPYTDFEDKSYIYNHTSNLYELNEDALDSLTPEIWHGVISPNSGDADTDVDLIQGYFDKNHDFYTGKGNFQSQQGIINANPLDEVSKQYTPYVFYYDQFRESQALSYERYQGYQAYLQNKEDIAYNRYTKELAEKVKNQVLGIQNENLKDLIEKAIPGFPVDEYSQGPDIEHTPDIQTRYITDNATNKFLEIFNEGTLGDIRKYVHNAGRYNGNGSEVHVDMAPFLISVLDDVSTQVVKNVNNELEDDITDIVANGLSRKIIIPTDKRIVTDTKTITETRTDAQGREQTYERVVACYGTQTNFYFGTPAKDITNASECSIYRGGAGGGNLVESNRGYNINFAQNDAQLCGLGMGYNETTGRITGGLSGFWGGNSPVNLASLQEGSASLELGTHNVYTGVRPVFDILGSKKITDTDRVPSPLDCFDEGRFITTLDEHLYVEQSRNGPDIPKCYTKLSVPLSGDSVQYYTQFSRGQGRENRPRGTTSVSRFCAKTNTGAPITTSLDHIQQYLVFAADNQNTNQNSNQDLSVGTTSTIITSELQNRNINVDTYVPIYGYKSITSHILHTSPTSEEFGKQAQHMTTPNLPVDKDRYIDFIGANGKYQKINYPYLFRVSPEANQELTLETIDAALKKHLDSVSAKVNASIRLSNPSSLSPDEKKVYDTYLNTGDYPSANVDLYKDLQSRPLQSFTIAGETKELSYYDTLVFAIYWNNLKTVSGKYKFIFENYLSDQFNQTDTSFPLPKNKKSYEIAYLGAPGDNQNMYIKLDPQSKANNPYASVIAKNITLNSTLSASKVTQDREESEGVFECAPPGGVPIWEWIPAVVCRLQNLLPPTISISEGSCGTSLLSEEEKEEIQECQGDVNKNGINDCIEGKLAGGQVELISDASKYYYNKVGTLGAVIRDKNGAVVTLDSTSYIDFTLSKLEIPANNELEFTAQNTKTIYDASNPNLNSPEDFALAQKYINFQNIESRASAGKAVSYFSTKRQDSNVTFSASLSARDQNNTGKIFLTSNPLTVQVRGDRLFLNSYGVEGVNNIDVSPAVSSMKVSEFETIYLIDTNKKYVEDVSASIYGLNPAEKKVILSLTNFSKGGNVLPLNYPLNIRIENKGKIIYEESDISESDLQNYKALSAVQKSGMLDFIVTDANGFTSNKTIQFLPEAPERLQVELGTTVSQTQGNLTTHMVQFYDKFDNITSGEVYSLDVKIKGGGLNFQSTNDETLETKSIEGYKIFRLKSTKTAANNTLTFTLSDAGGEKLAETTSQIRTVQNIDMDITPTSGAVSVGGGTYDFDIALKDDQGNPLNDFNSRAYLVVNPLYGNATKSFVEIKNGKATMQLRTSTVASRDVKLEFQVEGMNSIVNEYIDILPDDPIKLDLSLSRSKIEASPDDFSYLYGVLKDRYGNEVFTDSTTQLTLEIPQEYKDIITSANLTQTVKQGKAQFKISGTDHPGIGYFQVATSPSLAQNSFELAGQAPFSKQELTIPSFTNEQGLTDIGREFFTEYNSATYITRFSTKNGLQSSQAYQNLSPVLQQKVSDFWDQTDTLTVYGVGENAGSIETFYFWNDEHISGSKYNGIYSVLLGASYGDITQENYLGGSLIFDKDNRSLAVTSLLNSPYAYDDILRISRQGNISNIQSGGDITQDIALRPDFDSTNRMYVDVFNDALGTYVGKIYYNLSKTKLNICQEQTPCFDEKETSTSIRIQDSSYKIQERNGNLIIQDQFGSDMMIFAPDGSIERTSNLYIEINQKNTAPYLELLIQSQGKIVAVAQTQIVGGEVNITRDESILANKLQTLDNSIIAYLKTNEYGSRDMFEKNGTTEKIIFYNDPFGSSHRLDVFHNGQEQGFENFSQESGLGWQEQNKTLLLFSSGENVGNATKKYASFSLINLGDPVVSLKPIKRNFVSAPSLEKSFDPTIGKRISKGDDVISYQVFDYNKDEKQDVLFIKSDGYIELLENKDIAGDFLDKGNLVLAVDGGPTRLIKTGDFTGDGYDDIFFVSGEGEPNLFNNQEKDFVRTNLSEQMTLSGAIIQAEAFDMDDDSVDDIITLDDAGEIHIFYGGGVATDPRFTKLKVGSGYGIQLSDTEFSRGGAVYFDELPQVSNQQNNSHLITDTEQFNSQINSAIEQGQDPPEPEFFNEYLADALLFVELPYVPYNVGVRQLSDQELLQQAIDQGIDTSNYAEYDAYLQQAKDSFSTFVNENNDSINFNSSAGYSNKTSFLRSEYADTQGMTITKSFTDLSPEFLQTGDLVEVETRIKNTGGTTLNNVAFVDTIPKNFSLESEEIVVDDSGKTIPVKPGMGMFDILIDGFFLAPGEEVVMKYTLKTRPLKYGFMQVGLFEEGEIGDDPYGDIILKPDHLNCGEEADIYTSIAQRAYTKGKTTPTCDADALKLPDEIQKNTLDADGNGVPDYIDDLVGDQEEAKSYAQQTIDSMNTDSDGDNIPDADDDMPNINDEDSDFMSAIDDINTAVDDISAEIDTMIEGFSCGFGGGSCIATPLNWAPLAPGSDPTLFGSPIGDGLKVGEGNPIFSGLTGMDMTCGTSPCCIPTVYPASPKGFVPGPKCGPNSAGGSLGTWAPTNYVRIFVTPTLTGGVGMAACFGGPANVRGNIPPPGVSPVATGGNCIVAAVPLLGCDGEEGDPRITGYPREYPQYGVIHANCPAGGKDSKKMPPEIDNEFVKEYIDYKETGNKTPSLTQKFEDAFKTVAKEGGSWDIPSGPLINIGSGGDEDMALSVDFDPGALGTGDFEDVIQVQNTRVAAFPDFLMDWVTGQLEEVVNKLTNLPKIYVILPDFSGVFDYGWQDYTEDLDETFQESESQNDTVNANLQSRIDALKGQKDALGSCDGENRSRCRILDFQISQLKSQKDYGSPETLSGIKAAYEFLGNIPMVNVETETINVNVPWIDPASLERATVDWAGSLDQWKSEVSRAAAQWDLLDDDVAKQKLHTDAQNLVSSLERNMEILEEYKEFPEKLNELISIKEVRLEQILCNIEAISSLIGDWISDNGERFQAWVELYVLIKSVLKSWQLLIDVFKQYDEECHQCKNERQDLQDYTWKLISSVMPSLPIIQFPKWPDIVLDLHNVRVGMNVYLPDFQMNLRPIVLPVLPELRLPDAPNVNLELPELPLLPTFELPELPELPSLPTVELPDLPPPPEIPKLFGAVEGILNIMKLVTKVMCIIKQSPFVPEWRAGDQIAYITERGGFLDTDFIDISLPQFSYPFVEAITVTTYVNFEFEMEFILEAVRQITAPLDTFTNDISNMFDIQVPDIDLSEYTPSDINIGVELDGEVDVNGVPIDDLSGYRGTKQGFDLLAILFAKKAQNMFTYVHSQKDITLSNKEFIAYVHTNLATPTFTKDPRTQEIITLWDTVNNLTYAKEQKLIQDLLDNKDAKFQELEDIISTEISESQKLKEEVRNLGTPNYITQTSFVQNTRSESYNQRLEKYNEKLIESAINLVEGDTENTTYTTELLAQADSLKQEITTGINSYKQDLLAATPPSQDSNGEVNSCSYGGGEYEYKYEGLYVLEYDRHYRLFEYLDELRGDEYTTPIDVDQDGDDDLLYMVSGEVFLKENLKNKDIETHLSLPPLILNSGDNVFYNGETYYEAVNGFREANVSDSFINVKFLAPTDTTVDNFRMEFYTIVDKFRNLGDENYVPKKVKKFVVDAFSDIEENITEGKNQNYTLGKNLAYLKSAGVIPGAKLTNTKLIDITEDIRDNNIVTLTSGSKLYAGNNSFKIEYYTDSPENTQNLRVEKNSYVSFPSLTYIVGISGTAYVATSILEDIENEKIVGYVGKPLLPGASITYSGNDDQLTVASHIDIGYYDGSESELHMSEVSDYRLYDLGDNKNEHLIRLKVKNDFYYAKMYAFKSEISGTVSRQILLSPQTQADTEPPQIGLNQKIRIPVYQKKVFDFTPYIYEDSGIDNIKDVKIDFDFTTDNDLDGDPRNDRDTENMRIIQTPTKIAVEFGEYETLFTRKIRLSLTDGNGNVGYKDIDFEVYPPAPQIQSYENATIGGVIDETLLDEPVRMYRVRAGAIKKLENTQGSDLVNTTSTGSYEFGIPETAEGLVLQRDGVEIASVNEYTGKIDIKTPGATTQVLASNDPKNTDAFPRVSINYLGQEVFYEYIQPKIDQDIAIIQSPSEIVGEGIYVRVLDQDLYNHYKVPLGVRFNPGAVIISLNADEDKNPVFSIFRDGRIYSSNTNRYTLKYDSLGERSTYILYDTQTQTDVAQVILDIEASYILK